MKQKNYCQEIFEERMREAKALHTKNSGFNIHKIILKLAYNLPITHY